MTHSAADKKKALERELGYRRRVYPRWIEQNRMTKRQADQQIEIFEEIRDDYAKLEGSERLI